MERFGGGAAGGRISREEEKKISYWIRLKHDEFHWQKAKKSVDFFGENAYNRSIDGDIFRRVPAR